MKQLIKILRLAGSLKGYYIAIGLMSILLAAAQLLQPVITGSMIDLLQGGNAEIAKIVALVLLIFVMDFGSSIINNISGYLGDQMGSKLLRILGNRYYAQLTTLPQEYFDNELSGKIIGRLNRGAQQVSQFINMFANMFLQLLVTTVFSLALVAYYSWSVALVLGLIYPVFIFMTIRTSTKWQAWQKQRNSALDTALGRFSEAIGQIKVVKSFLGEPKELKHYDKYMKDYVNIGRPQSSFWHRRDVERRGVLAVIFLGVYMLIFVQAANGSLSVGQAVTLMLLALQIRIPIFSISFLVDNTQKAIADSRDYFEVLEQLPEPDEHKNKDLAVKSGEIEFKNVHFSYDDKKKVLQGISFKIKPDSKIALVGESGEGKTTITNLLLGFYQPQAGLITIDQNDINQFSRHSLRSNVSVVFQEASLFSGTIKENITYGKPGANKRQVIAAAKAANADEFIAKLEKGYDTEIGERGLKLSGGQKQRIAIARALLKDAPILVLDEATSSLDNRSELLVQEALEHLMRGRTTLIIAHRLTTIQNVDQIITIKNGRVDEVGTPIELSKTKGIYAELLNLRATKTESSREKLKEFEIAS